MPLDIWRRSLQLKYALKASISQDNPAKSITTEHWKGAYGKYKIGKEPSLTIIHEYFSSHLNILEVPQILLVPPWHLNSIYTYKSLSRII